MWGNGMGTRHRAWHMAHGTWQLRTHCAMLQCTMFRHAVSLRQARAGQATPGQAKMWFATFAFACARGSCL
eukprot:10658616-Lingulodinium_polyedra.AAC.1